MSAAAFAKGLLDLEGQLTPILVSSSNLSKKACTFLDNISDYCSSALLLNHLGTVAVLEVIYEDWFAGFSCQQRFAYARWSGYC